MDFEELRQKLKDAGGLAYPALSQRRRRCGDRCRSLVVAAFRGANRRRGTRLLTRS